MRANDSTASFSSTPINSPEISSSASSSLRTPIASSTVLILTPSSSMDESAMVHSFMALWRTSSSASARNGVNSGRAFSPNQPSVSTMDWRISTTPHFCASSAQEAAKAKSSSSSAFSMRSASAFSAGVRLSSSSSSPKRTGFCGFCWRRSETGALLAVGLAPLTVVTSGALSGALPPRRSKRAATTASAIPVRPNMTAFFIPPVVHSCRGRQGIAPPRIC